MIDDLLRYDPETGKVYWRVSPSNVIRAGSEAGHLDEITGYVRIGVGGKIYQAHRVAHRLMTGHWPQGDPEHENQIKSDNRWENIKDIATRSQNGANQGLSSRNTSLKGVSWYKKRGKWLAQIRVSSRTVHLGYFIDPILAGLTYDAAAKIVWGERFSCLNFSSSESEHIVFSARILDRLQSNGLRGGSVAVF